MEIENVNVHVPEGYKGDPIEIVLREGVAARPIDPVAPVAYGNKLILLTSMFAFIAGRNYATTPQENTGLLTYSLQPDNLSMNFDENPRDTHAPRVSSKLAINPDFVAFGINKDRYFSGRDLIKFARKYAHCFKSIDSPKALISALQNFEIKFEQVHKKDDDRAGNKNESIKNALKFTKGEVPLAWDLSMPLFVGADPVDFTIEIEIEAENAQPVFGFYSMEVEILLREQGRKVVLDEVNKFREQFTVLELA